MAEMIFPVFCLFVDSGPPLPEMIVFPDIILLKENVSFFISEKERYFFSAYDNRPHASED